MRVRIIRISIIRVRGSRCRRDGLLAKPVLVTIVLARHRNCAIHAVEAGVAQALALAADPIGG